MLRNIPDRCLRSFRYSFSALAAMFRREESFRLECVGAVILAVVMIVLDWPAWKILAMSASYLLIPLLEVVNTAIEDVCDLITTEKTPLIKSAKDKGALAVLLAIIINALVFLLLGGWWLPAA